ncbi:MAG: YraN family protein [Patescibacteria group bacterium]|jgi:Holliday junction resolvase-like predicted endonuclease
MGRVVAGIGKWGEEQAAKFLVRQGFQVIENNYNASVGEIDIVAKKDSDFYFVEVKTRSAGPMANDLSVTREKRRKIHKTILHYCSRRGLRNVGLIPVSLMVVVNRKDKKLNFRFSVLY